MKPSRTALVAFFNDVLQLNIAKVDDLGTGAAYCQLLDSIYGDLPMHRVKFDAHSPMEIEQNYKILQQAFLRHQINKNFDSMRLMKCRLQDNLDFSQWFYQFWHESPHIDDYDPVLRRSGAPQSISAPKPRRAPTVVGNRAPPQSQQTQGAATQRIKPLTQTPLAQASEQTLSRTPARLQKVDEQESLNRIVALEDELDELGKTVDVLMEERSLYYEKLLDIEQLMNQQIDELYSAQGSQAAMEHAKDPMLLLIRKIQEILFSSPEGFEPQLRPEDEPF